DPLAIDPHLALARRQQAIGDAQERGLAAARWPQERDEGSGGDGERDIGERLEDIVAVAAGIAMRDVADLDHRAEAVMSRGTRPRCAARAPCASRPRAAAR